MTDNERQFWDEENDSGEGGIAGGGQQLEGELFNPYSDSAAINEQREQLAKNGYVDGVDVSTQSDINDKKRAAGNEHGANSQAKQHPFLKEQPAGVDPRNEPQVAESEEAGKEFELQMQHQLQAQAQLQQGNNIAPTTPRPPGGG
jgi:hypothetical protein